MTLWAEETGAGPPVVLLHAGVADARMWEPQWASLAAAGHRVLRCDLPGFGRTPLQRGPVSPAGEVVALLDAHGIERAAFVAASMGGLVALEIAIARPERVSALVLAAAPLPDHDFSATVTGGWEAEESALERGDVEAAVEACLRLWVDGPARRPDEVDPALRASVGAMQRQAFELQLAVGEDSEDVPLVPDVPERLGEIRAPALVLVGELDVADFRDIADRLARELAGAAGGARSIAGAAHLPSLERPAAFDALAVPFLAERAE